MLLLFNFKEIITKQTIISLREYGINEKFHMNKFEYYFYKEFLTVEQRKQILGWKFNRRQIRIVYKDDVNIEDSTIRFKKIMKTLGYTITSTYVVSMDNKKNINFKL
jgi:hypothetical protein